MFTQEELIYIRDNLQVNEESKDVKYNDVIEKLNGFIELNDLQKDFVEKTNVIKERLSKLDK